MKRVIAGTFVAAAFAVGLSAQSTPPQTQPPTPPRTQPPMQEAKDASEDRDGNRVSEGRRGNRQRSFCRI